MKSIDDKELETQDNAEVVDTEVVTAETQLNTEEMDGDAKKSQSFSHNRRVKFGTNIIFFLI